MGMAASQARLLSLTSRLHDVEYKAQNIEAQKIALATQKDELYQNYCDALDATKIQVAFRNADASVSYVDANYSRLCDYSETRVKQYALIDSQSGNMIVSQEVADKYKSYTDKYAFAYAMLGFEGNFGWENGNQGCEIGIGIAQEDYGYYSQSGTGYSLYMTECEQDVYDSHSEDTKLVDAFEAIEEAENDSDKQKALDEFREYLYSKYSDEIFDRMNIIKGGIKGDAEDDNALTYPDTEWEELRKEFNYYVQLYEGIETAGGCTVLEERYMSGEAGNDWFQNMVEAGLVTIQIYNTDGANKGWVDTNVATSTNENYLQEVQDETDLKRAEAEYEYELDKINQKDSKYDTDLSKLETERTSITTEMDALKQVRDDNIERTFGIFS